MKKGEMIILPQLVKNILYRNSDEEHLVSMPDLLAYLEEEGYTADRRSVYKAINVLNETGENIVFERNGDIQGYKANHPFTNSEILFLCNAALTSKALSKTSTDVLLKKLSGFLSDAQKDSLPKTTVVEGKTDNDNVLDSISLLLKAIRLCCPVEFRYFDIGISRKKTYRRQSRKYHLIPYSIVCRNERYYCIFYSEKYKTFANYRIDKMDMITILSQEITDPVPFDLDAHLRSSFQMYHGNPQTVTIRFDLSMTDIVFDTFGTDIIITAVDENTFTAAIKTAITPTLISWLLQFYDRCTVLKPQELIEELMKTANCIQKTYGE